MAGDFFWAQPKRSPESIYSAPRYVGTLSLACARRTTRKPTSMSHRHCPGPALCTQPSPSKPKHGVLPMMARDTPLLPDTCPLSRRTELHNPVYHKFLHTASPVQTLQRTGRGAGGLFALHLANQVRCPETRLTPGAPPGLVPECRARGVGLVHPRSAGWRPKAKAKPKKQRGPGVPRSTHGRGTQ